MEREGRKAPARGVALDLFPGWSQTTGHPVPLREGGELAPLSHTRPIIYPAKSKKENERGTQRDRSQLSLQVLGSALRLRSQGKWGWGHLEATEGRQGLGVFCVSGGGLQEMIDNRCQRGVERAVPVLLG